MKIKILLIDDDQVIRSDYTKLLTGEIIGEYEIAKVESVDFTEGIEKLKEEHFDIVILDLCKGDPSPESEKTGEEVLSEIQKTAFVPVIFFTGLPAHVEGIVSEIIKVCNKGDVYEGLKLQIAAILESDYLKLKNKIVQITNESIRSFFWDFVHPKKELISSIKDEISLTYLLLRRLSKMLSKDQIRNFIDDNKPKEELAHSMEFYIYPPLEGEFQMGDILLKKDSREIYVILTPSCDLIERSSGGRKAENILLLKANCFDSFPDYQSYLELVAKKEKSSEYNRKLKNLEGHIKNWMRNNQGNKDRFFYLPQTVFLKASIVDFQYLLFVQYPNLTNDFKVIARLDDPFAQSLLSAFTRYYNRIGFPDLDIDYEFNQLFSLTST